MKPVVTYDDPIFTELEAKLDESIRDIENLIPHDPIISSDDEWNSSEYDYENFVSEQGDDE